jgi:hypothetical protein
VAAWKWIAGVIGAIAGTVAAYYLVAYTSCTWLWPGSNLCGITGVPAALVGAICGFLIGFRLVSKIATPR